MKTGETIYILGIDRSSYNIFSPQPSCDMLTVVALKSMTVISFSMVKVFSVDRCHLKIDTHQLFSFNLIHLIGTMGLQETGWSFCEISERFWCDMSVVFWRPGSGWSHCTDGHQEWHAMRVTVADNIICIDQSKCDPRYVNTDHWETFNCSRTLRMIKKRLL